jgi:hypothetical protein
MQWRIRRRLYLVRQVILHKADAWIGVPNQDNAHFYNPHQNEQKTDATPGPAADQLAYTAS